MALSAAMGAIDTLTGTTAVTVSGLSFQPKVVIFTGGSSGAIDTTSNTGRFSFGAATGATEEACAFIFDMDNTAGNSRTNRALYTSACFGTVVTTADAIDGLFEFTSFQSDGFTVTPTDAFVTGCDVAYLALGGADLTNVKVGTFSATTDAVANQAVTGVGFEPDGLILFTTTATAADTLSSGAFISIGWTDGTDQGCIAFGSQDNVATSVVSGLTSTTRCLVLRANADDTLAQEYSFVSFNADGFTLNRDVGTVDNLVGYIAFKGVAVKAGTFASIVGTTTSTPTVGFLPRAVMMLTSNNPTATETAFSPDGKIGVGWASGAGGCSSYIYSTDATASSNDTMCRVSTSICLPKWTRTGASTWIDGGTGDVDGFNATTFTYDQVVADTQATLNLFFAFGDTPASSNKTRGLKKGLARGLKRAIA